MRAGRLKHKISIEQATYTAGSPDYGQQNVTWSEFASVWASIDPVKGNEYWMTQQIQAETVWRFRVRYLSGISPKMRISWDSRTFDITAVLPNEMLTMTEILATEVMT